MEDSDSKNIKRCDCGHCDEWIPTINKKGKPARYKHGHNMRGKSRDPKSLRYGSNHHWWTGGVKVHNGYRLILKADHPRADVDGYVREHILVMEEILGRALEPGEIPHHINHDKLDNRKENLKLISSKADHVRLHMLKDMSNRICAQCGRRSEQIKRRWRKIENEYYCNACFDWIMRQGKTKRCTRRLSL